MKDILRIIFIISILLLAVSAVTADPEVPEWVDFYGTLEVNGAPAPIGTIVEAYDPDGIMCGVDTTSSVGLYGFLHVYADDIDTPGIDEGCSSGDSVSFKINGLDATRTVVSGVLTWTSNGAQNEVSLDNSSAVQNVAFSIITLPVDTLGAPGHTIRFVVEIQNDGNGTDFYAVDAPSDLSGNNAWTSFNQDTLSYAEPGLTTTVWFDISLPVFGGGPDTANIINYTVYSVVDPTVTYDGSIVLYKSITDADDPWDILPNAFGLYQNYPNPFNPITSIAFELPAHSEVKLEIYNTLGQLVDIVVNGFMPAGYHEIEYDATKLASGVYFYRLITDDNSISKKMVLLK